MLSFCWHSLCIESSIKNGLMTYRNPTNWLNLALVCLNRTSWWPGWFCSSRGRLHQHLPIVFPKTLSLPSHNSSHHSGFTSLRSRTSFLHAEMNLWKLPAFPWFLLSVKIIVLAYDHCRGRTPPYQTALRQHALSWTEASMMPLTSPNFPSVSKRYLLVNKQALYQLNH